MVSYVLFINTADSRNEVCPDVAVPQTQAAHPKTTAELINGKHRCLFHTPLRLSGMQHFCMVLLTL